MENEIRILIVEDLASDAELNIRETRKVLDNCSFKVVDTEKEFINSLGEFRPHLILSDYSMPEFDGLTALSLAVEHSPETPVIIVTGSVNEDTAVECMKAGASNYVIKQHIKRLGSAVLHALEERKLNISHKQARLALQESEQRYKALFDLSPVGILVQNSNNYIINVNQAYCRITGYDKEQLIGNHISVLVPGNDADNILVNTATIFRDSFFSREAECIRRDRSIVNLELTESSILLEKGEKGIMTIAIDITERKKAEEALRRSEAKYHDLFEANKDGISIIPILPDDTISKFLEINETGASMLGYSKQEILDIPVIKLETGVSETELKKRKENLVNYGTTSFESEFIHKSGKLVPVEVKAMVIMFEGRPSIMNIVREIADRKQTELLQRMLYNIASAAITVTNLEKFFECVSSELSVLMDTRNFYIAFYNETNRMLNSPFEREEKQSVKEWQAEKSLTGLVIKTQTSMLLRREQIREMAEEGLITQIGDPSEIWMGVPLKAGNVAFGAIVVQSYDNPDAYNENSLRILEITANELSTFIQRKKAEEETRKLSKAIEQNPVAIVITDINGTVEYVNPKFTAITHYSPEEIIGKTQGVLKSGEQPDEVYKELWATISSGKNWQGELKNKRKDGSDYWENVVISPIFDESGSITNYVAVKEDITDMKNIIVELSIAKEKAEESDRLKTAFLQNISHEIRTPLNGILGFSELLIQDWTTAEEKVEYSEAIRISGKRLIEIISNVLDISIIETGQIILNPNYFDLNSLFYELKGFYQSQAAQKNLSFHADIPAPGEGRMVYADRSRINQVLANLLNNAIKFTKQGDITFGYQLQNKEIVFTVRDTGIGIKDEHKNRIFTRFYQAEHSSARSYEGAGLGLSISHGLVEAMGGNIWFESKVGEGTTFFFSIPVAGATMNEDEQDSGTSIHKKSDIVMIAEDDYTSYQLLLTTLKKWDIGVIRAETGIQAVEMVKANKRIKLVLMDIKMPEMDGFEATRIIKSLRSDLPVVIQTAYAFKDDNEKAFAYGCDDFITKPISTEKLFVLLERFLGTKPVS